MVPVSLRLVNASPKDAPLTPSGSLLGAPFETGAAAFDDAFAAFDRNKSAQDFGVSFAPGAVASFVARFEGKSSVESETCSSTCTLVGSFVDGAAGSIEAF